MQELWKNLPGYNGRYLVSSRGRVRDLRPGRSGPGGPVKRDSRERIYRDLKTFVEKKGYVSVSLVCLDGVRRTHFVNCLVLLAFVGPRPNPKDQCRHLDGDNQNNQLENLAWGSQIENTHDSAKINCWPFRLTKSEAVEILKQYDGERGSIARLARKYQVGETAISNLVKRKTWKFL